VHAVDVEGKQSGIEEDLVAFLGQFCPIPVTYAGGVRSIEVSDYKVHPRFKNV
jgi:phosphoribosylformimino-5-aminoimidazole carboxamide ribotide isomerase